MLAVFNFRKKLKTSNRFAELLLAEGDVFFSLSSHWGVGPYGPEVGKGEIYPVNHVDPV